MAANEVATVHEGCALERASERLDANGDGRPEIQSVRQGGRTVCRAIDLNWDGAVDVWIYYDAAGKVRRREYAFGRDGTVNEVRLYAGGVLEEIRQATAGRARFDTWHFVERGRVVRSERDADQDGRIEQWWEYPRADQPECPVMFTDADGDGRRDGKAGVDLCAEGYVPPPREEAGPTAPELRGPVQLPTEAEPPTGVAGGEDADAS